MGYQRVVKPRLFVDMMSYLHATGHGVYFNRKDSEHSDTPIAEQIHYGEKVDLLYCNTPSVIKFTEDQPNHGGDTLFNYIDYDWVNTGINFPVLPIDCLVCLNHNLEGMKFSGGSWTDDVTEWGFPAEDNLVNWTDPIAHNGFSIRLKSTPVYTSIDTKRLYAYFSNHAGNVGQRYMGSYFFGKTWTPPHNPNLSMTVSRSFDGIKQTKTQGGHTMNNINYLGNPNWAGHNAWELWNYPEDPSVTLPNEDPDSTQQQMFIEDPKLNLGRLGRRSWKLTFELVSESDIFAALEQSNILPFDVGDTYPEGTATFTELGIDNPILQEDNFISRVWIPTLGGKIPMLMQVDDTNNNPDQFAIVTIKSNTFSVKPKAPNLYSFSMILEESW